MSGDAPLRIGLLGASRIATLAVTDASRQTGDVRAAVAARDPERARAYAEEHGYDRVAADYEELDLVYVGLPNGLHGVWAARALEAGRNVLVEKPFAANLTEFDRVASRMGDARGWAWEAFHYADHPAIRRLIEIVVSGEIGDVESVDVHMDMPAPAPADPRWSFDLAGGAMMDLGCYAVHALLLLGDAIGASPAVVDARADRWGDDTRVDARVVARLELGGRAASLHTSMISEGWDFGLEVTGHRGSVRLPNFVKPQEDDRLVVRVDGREPRVERTGVLSSYVYQLRRLRHEIRAGARNRDGLDRSRRTIALIDEIYAAAGMPERPGRLLS